MKTTVPKKLTKKQRERLTNAQTEELGIRYPDGLTKQLARDIVHGIRTGATPRMACVAAGVSLAKYDRWFARGQLMSSKVAEGIIHEEVLPDEDKICHAFYKMVMEAAAVAASFCSAKLRKSKDWRAQAFRLEKIYSKFFDPEVVTTLGPDGLPVGEGTKVTIYIPDNGRSTK